MKNIGIILAVIGGVLTLTYSVSTEIPPDIITSIENKINETDIEFLSIVLTWVKKIIQAGGVSVIIGALISLYSGRTGSLFILLGIAGGLFVYIPEIYTEYNNGLFSKNLPELWDYFIKKGYSFFGVAISFLSFFLVRLEK